MPPAQLRDSPRYLRLHIPRFLPSAARALGGTRAIRLGTAQPEISDLHSVDRIAGMGLPDR